jgi:hypothetical protein
MEICQALETLIKNKDEEKTIKCSHPESDIGICLKINYDLWLLNIQHKDLCQNKTKNIKQ